MRTEVLVMADNISIEFGKHQHPSPLIFLSDDGVAGHVVVSNKGGTHFDSVRVILEGQLHNSLCTIDGTCKEANRMEMGQKLIHMVHTQQSFQQRNQLPLRERVFPFHFTIPNHILIPNNGDSSTDMVHPLPPSMHVNVDSVMPSSGQQRAFRGGCKVSYTLRAYIILNGRPVGGTSRSIVLFPTLEPQPPSCTTDFPGEYVLSASSTLRSTVLYRRVGRLVMEAREPRELEFCRKNQEASTAIHLKFMFHESREGSSSEPPPTPDFGVMGLKLKQMTFISVEPQRKLPATHDALVSPFIARDSRIISSQSRKLKFSPWVRSRYKGNVKEALGRVWETSSTLIFTFGNGGYPAPTCGSALVSRRYSLCMALNIEGANHAILELEVPVQVIYRGTPQSELLRGGGFSSSRALPNESQLLQMLPRPPISGMATDEEAPIYIA
ncbi:hypothetical protein FQN55_008647 [Onygenales sp. PD_40]|nr:hypothetical protein FQN55_008647 [Onygenales sp. PD_40]